LPNMAMKSKIIDILRQHVDAVDIPARVSRYPAPRSEQETWCERPRCARCKWPRGVRPHRRQTPGA
jgi:hypothetical protein